MLQNEMLAVKIVQDRTIRIETTDLPRYGPNEVLVRVHCVGLCATDLHVYQGLQNHRVRFPITPGHEWSGEVVAMGEDVQGFTVGDRVVGEVTIPCGNCPLCKKGDYHICPKRVECGVFGKDGAAAQYISIPSFALHKIPSSLSYEDACLIEPTAIVYRSIEKVGVTPADRVLVVGAGPIGLLTVAVAKVFGASDITIVDLRENRLQVGKKMGAAHTINIANENYVEKAHEVTGGKLFDVIIEASGNASALESLFDVTALGARICLVGIFDRKASIDPNVIIRKDLKVYGSVGCPNVWQHVIPLVESGKVPVKEIVTHYQTLHDFESLLLKMENLDSSLIKALVRP